MKCIVCKKKAKENELVIRVDRVHNSKAFGLEVLTTVAPVNVIHQRCFLQGVSDG